MFVLFKDPCRSETLWNNVDHRCEGRVPLTALVLELALGMGCPPSLTPELQTIHQAALVKKVSKWVADDHRPTDHWARHRRGRESRWWPAHACGVGHVMPVMFPFLVSHPFCLSRETRDQAERTYIRLASQLRGGLQMNEHSVIDSNGNWHVSCDLMIGKFSLWKSGSTCQRWNGVKKCWHKQWERSMYLPNSCFCCSR